jgi:hypothetical protein
LIVTGYIYRSWNFFIKKYFIIDREIVAQDGQLLT